MPLVDYAFRDGHTSHTYANTYVNILHENDFQNRAGLRFINYVPIYYTKLKGHLSVPAVLIVLSSSHVLTLDLQSKSSGINKFVSKSF